MVATRFVLDANVISDLTKQNPNAKLIAQFKRHRTRSCTAAPVLHDLHFGVQALPEGACKNLLRLFLEGLLRSGLDVLAYDQRAAVWHADERARLQRVGKPRPVVDGQIAAIAAVNDAVLVTRNVDDFALFNGLRLRDWFAKSP
jgi:tRNA(fMet)-specific endonuclease VapC